MLSIVFVPWLSRMAWVRTEERFSADDPWNENRRTDFTIETYIPTLTGKAVGPWSKYATVWMTAFTRALRSETDGATHMMPDSLTDLWSTGEVPSQAIPDLLKAIQPSLKQLDYRGTPGASPPILSILLEWLLCLIGVFVGIALAFTAHGSPTIRLLWAIAVGGGMILLSYPTTTIKRYRRRRQIKWFLQHMRTRSEPFQSQTRQTNPQASQEEPPIENKEEIKRMQPVETSPASPPVISSATAAIVSAGSIKTLAEIKAEIDCIATSIGAKKQYWYTLPIFSTAKNWDSTRIDVDALGYHFFCCESGREYEFAVTQDFDKILYWSFKRAVALLAADYAREYRMPGQDPRRLSHPRGIELFTLVSPACAQRCRAEIETSMLTYPYDDNYDSRLALHQELIGQGIPGEDSWRTVLEKYPPMTGNQSLRPF